MRLLPLLSLRRNPELAGQQLAVCGCRGSPQSYWQNRRAALEEMPVVRDYPYGGYSGSTAMRAGCRNVSPGGCCLILRWPNGAATLAA